MSRIRTIKPGFFIDEELAELTPLNRLLFIGLWTLADGEGRLEDRPKRIRAQLHPYDDGDTNAMLQALHDAGFITRYTVDGANLIEIRNFKKHQRITGKEAEADSSLPPIPAGNNRETTGKQSGNNGETAIVQEGKGKEGKGREEEGSTEARKRATHAPAPKSPCPADLTVTPELNAWAIEHGYSENLQQHLDHFRDKAQAKGYQYANWEAAFRNAIRDDWAGLRKPPPIEKIAAARGGGRAPAPSPAFAHNPKADEFATILSGRPIIEGECAHAA